ncbi:MAG: DUF1593 domain-containing protein [Isosphaeraceae bacterium]
MIRVDAAGWSDRGKVKIEGDHMAFALFCAACVIGALADQDTPTAERIRIAVLTDISSLTPGVAEPDDGQSLIRLMLHANEFEIEALIATSNLGHGQETRPDLIGRVVDAYGRVQPNLLVHDRRYPPADRLRRCIKAGQPIAGPRLPVERSVGQDRDTEASQWIIGVADRPDPRPIWVVIWGGSADLAQALWKVRRTRSPEDLRRFVSRLRVHAIGDQDSTGPWIREQVPELYVITQRRAYRGMYRGGDRRLVSPEWVEANIHGHGALGDLYPNYRGGDIWSATLGPVRGIKEGDTPSFLSLVPNGLGDPERPWLGGWGGRFEGDGRRLTDVPDTDLDTRSDPEPRMSSVYRWRPAFQADFAARFDWCVKPFKEANHPPIVRIEGPTRRAVKPGETIALDASPTTDPDGDRLSFEWTVEQSAQEAAKLVEFRGEGTPTPRVRVGPVAAGATIPVLLTVTDGGTPSLTRYGRITLRVGPPD